MFDFRYHIISLVAVFLALGMGILVGTMIGEKGAVSQPQKALVERIEADFGQLRAENRLLNEQNQANEKFQRAVLPVLISGQLVQKNVALVVTTSLDPSIQKVLANVFEMAGGRLVSTTTLAPHLALDKKENVEKVNTLLGVTGLPLRQLKGRVLGEIARNLVTGQNPKFIGDLAASGIIATDGAYDVPVNAVAIVGGSEENKKDDPETIDIPLMKALLEFNIQVVGAETTKVKVSYMPIYQRTGIATVDNIDSPIGEISLVYALKGERGNFGIKSTAQQAVPPLVRR